MDRVLIIAGKTSWGEKLVPVFTQAGFSVVYTSRMQEKSFDPYFYNTDIVILDDDTTYGMKLCRYYSSNGVPVIIAGDDTGEEIWKKTVEEAGAETYFKKHISNKVLIAQTKAILRRYNTALLLRVKNVFACSHIVNLRENQSKINGMGYILNPATRQLVARDKYIALTPTEWLLISILVKHEGRPVRHQRLIQEIWKSSTIQSKTAIKQYISRIRKKIGDNPQDPKIIKTEYGFGYRLVRPMQDHGQFAG